MSGTSLDGIDVAYTEIEGASHNIKQNLLAFDSVKFSPEIKEKIREACLGNISMRECFELDTDLGLAYSNAIYSVGKKNKISPENIDAVGLHGQTIYHNPQRTPSGVTVQIGSASVVSQRLKTIVVNDFRTQDVALGGQGAPLVPYCDFLLLHNHKQNRVALNIGGIANITWLGKQTTKDNIIAFDTGFGNMPIDFAMNSFFNKNYDNFGETAMLGKPHKNLVYELLQQTWFLQPPPKSTGREQFGEDFTKDIIYKWLKHGLSEQDIIATLTFMTSYSIAFAIKNFCLPLSNAVQTDTKQTNIKQTNFTQAETLDEIIVGGGGFHNKAMMNFLQSEFPTTKLKSSIEYNLPHDAKEAICFAILANECLNEIPANLPSVTGASNYAISGAIRIC